MREVGKPFPGFRGMLAAGADLGTVDDGRAGMVLTVSDREGYKYSIPAFRPRDSGVQAVDPQDCPLTVNALNPIILSACFPSRRGNMDWINFLLKRHFHIPGHGVSKLICALSSSQSGF